MKPRVVVDTNVLFSALVRRRSNPRATLLSEQAPDWFAPRYVLVELFRHHGRLLEDSELSQEELIGQFDALIHRLHFQETDSVPLPHYMEAYRLCRGVDLKDIPFVALSLHLDAPLWTNDQPLKDILRSRGFDRFYSP